ncbi:MAG TPA: hypothetical protein DCS66_13560, partial [Flavobacteriaceae bacterium]|nr:hypothetical protein [Flavobacteriaceae bacterium]
LMTDKFSENIVNDLQTNMVMSFLEQGKVKNAENMLEEFGLSKKEIKELFKENHKYMKIIKEKK